MFFNPPAGCSRNAGIIFFLAVFCSFSPTQAQNNCIRIGESFSNLDSAFRSQLSVQRFSDHEVWQKGKCYVVVVGGKITSYNNQDKCLQICDVTDSEKSKESIERWLLKTLSEYGTGRLVRGYETTTSSQSFQRYWFNDYYLVIYYTESYGRSDWDESVQIPIQGIMSIVGVETPYYMHMRRNAYWILNKITFKKEEKVYDTYRLHIDEKGEKGLDDKLFKAFKDLRKYYKSPPEKKDLY